MGTICRKRSRKFSCFFAAFCPRAETAQYVPKTIQKQPSIRRALSAFKEAKFQMTAKRIWMAPTKAKSKAKFTETSFLRLHDAILTFVSVAGFTFQSRHPPTFCSDLRKIKARNGAPPGIDVRARQGGLDAIEAPLAPPEKAVALLEDALSHVAVEHGKQAHAQTKLVIRR